MSSLNLSLFTTSTASSLSLQGFFSAVLRESCHNLFDLHNQDDQDIEKLTRLPERPELFFEKQMWFQTITKLKEKYSRKVIKYVYLMANSKNTFLAVGKQLLRTALPVQANKFCTTALRKSSEVPHITSADRKSLKIISKSFSCNTIKHPRC